MAELKQFKWAVIGAGPAGITAIGKLLDYGVEPKQLVWIDPDFTVGDFGTKWREVPSNTKVQLFLDFLNAAKSFDFKDVPKDFELLKLDPQSTCELKYMADVLQWVSNHLRTKVCDMVASVDIIHCEHQKWHLTMDDKLIAAENVVLATGSEAKTLSHMNENIISLDDAMDKNKLSQLVSKENRVAVFGSSHSAILAIKNLIQAQVKQVINFYQSPLRYALSLPEGILFDDTGLKGTTAMWARENINDTQPDNLLRVHSHDENIQHYLPQCDSVIYAVGFQKRMLPFVEGLSPITHQPKTGIIAPGLFGLGIAFPESRLSPWGFEENRAGLWKFMDYANRIVPIWLKYSL